MTAFAEINSAMNSAIVEFLADAEADFGEGVIVQGLFREPNEEAFGMVTGTKPTFEALTSALATVNNGDAVSINAIAYSVVEQKLRNGMTTLVLGEV